MKIITRSEALVNALLDVDAVVFYTAHKGNDTWEYVLDICESWDVRIDDGRYMLARKDDDVNNIEIGCFAGWSLYYKTRYGWKKLGDSEM